MLLDELIPAPFLFRLRNQFQSDFVAGEFSQNFTHNLGPFCSVNRLGWTEHAAQSDSPGVVCPVKSCTRFTLSPFQPLPPKPWPPTH
jgi:hypothetical protein